MEKAYTEIILSLMAEKIMRLRDEIFIYSAENERLRRENEDLRARTGKAVSKNEQTFVFSEVQNERSQMGENHDGYL
ncbi:MAG: hypothetical protein IKM00_07580 [Clostridia bacterium]|nr:hypothetical protein [Clostridia bacterium]